jgi:steroid delta-isomerase-like uncharacterized protein
MAADENTTSIRRWYDEVWNAGKLELIDELFASTFTDHSPNPGMPPTRDGLTQTVRTYRGAFPDLHFTVDDLLAAGDRVITRWTAEGTHAATLGDLPATGTHARVTGIDINRVFDGKIMEHWGNWDQLSLLQQLGIVPLPEQARQAGT